MCVNTLIFIDSFANTSSAIILAILSVYVLKLKGDLAHYGNMMAIFGVAHAAVDYALAKK